MQREIGTHGSQQPWERLRVDLHDLRLVAGRISVVVGSVVLVGWALEIDVLKSIIPGVLSMKVNTATAFVLIGLGLMLAGRTSTDKDRRLALAPVLGGMLLAALVGSQYITGVDLGIDQWLVRELPGEVGTIQPNRMSPMTVICFLLVGSGIILATVRRVSKVVPALLLAALLVALLNALDFMFSAGMPSMLAGYTQMALTTSLTMMVLAVGALGLLPANGLLHVLVGPSASARLARQLMVAALVVPGLFAWLRLQGEDLGLYGPRFGVSLTALGTFVLMSYVILRSSRSSQRLETARQSALEERDRFFDVSIDMLATANANGYFVRLNPAWTETLGYQLDELKARPFVDFVHPDDVAATNAEAARQIDEGKSVLNFQNRYRHRDGSYRWLEWTSTPSADGRLLHAVARDITDRRLEEERLRAPEVARARRLAEARERIEATLASGTFGPVFQPVVDLITGSTVGYEALTRFSDGHRPDEMFAAALECGLGSRLETATLGAAVAAARELPRREWLSLNVSPTLLADVDRLSAALGLRARPLVLEVTEHETIQAYGPLREAVLRLGGDVRLAVDDAGAGVANFNHLVELRPAFVKIDSGLVRGVDADPSRRAVVVGLVHFAAEAGSQVIAEGIETDEELLTLRELGVTFGQGYLLGRPAPVAAWSEAHRPDAAGPTLRLERRATIRAATERRAGQAG